MAFHQLFIIKQLKTTAMLINNINIHHNMTSIVIDNNIIVYSFEIINLGMAIDDRLSFKTHITELSKSVHGTLHTIRLIRPSITTNHDKLLVTSLVLYRLDYG